MPEVNLTNETRVEKVLEKKQCFLLHPWKLTCNLQINQLWTFICKHMLWIWTILQNEPIIILISFCLAKLTKVVFLTLFTTFCNMFNMLYIRICRLIFSLCSFSRFPSCQKSPFCILHLESNTFSPRISNIFEPCHPGYMVGPMCWWTSLELLSTCESDRIKLGDFS